MSDCYRLKKKEERQHDNVKPTGLTSLKTTPQSCLDSKTIVQVKDASPDISMDGYEPFISEGTLSLRDSTQRTPITILRDTGASQYLILADVLPLA